jgi:very-short-patch-repair endonuclease
MANALARHLRKNLTVTEEKLWLELRLLRQQGYHFRRQVPLEGYIVDFACLSQRVLIEVDGAQHAEPEMMRKDSNRDAHLHWRGFTVLRFSNFDVMENCDGCMLEVLAALGAVQRQE